MFSTVPSWHLQQLLQMILVVVNDTITWQRHCILVVICHMCHNTEYHATCVDCIDTIISHAT